MKSRYLGFLFAVFTTFVSVDAFAFKVEPGLSTGSEGTQQALTVTVEVNDWVYTGGESNSGCFLNYEFVIDLATTGDATWSNDQLNGDIR